MLKAILFDIDGTLVDSNDAHAAAWVKAFTEHGVTVDPVLVRRCIGMGAGAIAVYDGAWDLLAELPSSAIR